MNINRIHLSYIFIITFLMLCFLGCGSTGGGTQDATASIVLSLGDSNTISADGSSSIAITAYIANSAGEPVKMNTGVTFETTLGTFKNGANKYTVSTIDDSGVVTVSLISSTTPGIAEVTCSSSGVTQSIKIYFTHDDNSGLPVGEGFSLALTYLNMSGLWIAGLENRISAYLVDYDGDAVQDGIQVSFKTYNTGGFFDHDVAVTGGTISDDSLSSSGVAVSTLVSSDEPTPMQGFVSVTAETDGGATTAITSIAVTPNENHILYAGTNGGGIYKSTDKGSTWENISRSSLNARAGQNWLNPYIKGHSSISVDPDDHNTIYVGTGYLGQGTLFRSLDGGMNWNSNNVEEWNGIYSANAAIISVLCDDNGSDYVWLGTEGKGIFYATDGANFQPAGGMSTKPQLTTTSVGNGTMTTPSLNSNSKSETWTATCFVAESSASPVPVLEASDSGANGWMSNLTLSSDIGYETWVVQYFAQAQNITTPTSKGTVININPKKVVDETWTLKCIYADPDDPGLTGGTSTMFSVIGSITGRLEHAQINTDYSSDYIDFKIIAGNTPFIVGDEITFEVKTQWTVTGSSSGTLSNTASTGTPYVSDNGEIGFTIFQGTIPFAVGDYFVFSTTSQSSSTYWIVEGSVSGVQNGIAQNNTVYTSDGGEVNFIIYEGSTAFATGDQFSFQVTSSTIGYGWTVWDIVKVPGTNGANAILYAATNVGVMKSTNGGKTWNYTDSFTGDFITCIDLIQTSNGNNVLYVGTQNAGVWSSLNGGNSWTSYSNGIGEGTSIKDLTIDPINNKIYAIAYYGTSGTSSGTIFMNNLNSDKSISSSSWVEINQGLSGSPLYTIDIDNIDSPSEIFVGGEGINFYKAYSDFNSQTSSWRENNSGLTNTIMTRAPVLFSGECSMGINSVWYGSTLFLTVYIQDTNGNPPIQGSAFKVEYHSETDGDFVFTDIKYPDAYTYQGTFSDPNNPYTNNPYRYSQYGEPGDYITLTYTPACHTSGDAQDAQAGCSGGGEETVTIYF